MCFRRSFVTFASFRRMRWNKSIYIPEAETETMRMSGTEFLANILTTFNDGDGERHEHMPFARVAAGY